MPACTSSQPKEEAPVVTMVQDTVPSTLSLLFVGDLMQHQSQIDAAKRAEGYDYTASFLHVKDEIEKADIAIGNLECSLGGKPYAGYPCFSAPDEFLFAIHNAGFDMLNTANNHCLDRGSKGGIRTIQLLDSLSIPHLGTYPDSATQVR
ncbi:MAG: CapA family protein, partial [Bacteroidaceae bacterium]|nr:CapA family protein [Bacteroidaceae bacterium]